MLKPATSLEITSVDGNAKLSTEQLAVLMHVKPNSIRSAFCRQGHYMGMVPVKLPNRRLLWDVAQVQTLLDGEVLQPTATDDLSEFQKLTNEQCQ